MANERHGFSTWPGALAIERCNYTTSHGISPGVAELIMQPQAVFPAMYGDLVITDEVGTITLRDCKIDDIRVAEDDRGFFWQVKILDRRWRWTDLGSISAALNQLDAHAKLIPWTIRSPYEMAKLCLDAMQEQSYRIDMPPGLARAVGERHFSRNPPWIGVIPVTGTNPPVNWENATPAAALQSLCEQFGRRVIYRWSTDSVLIAVPGRGGDLPSDIPIASETPTIKNPTVPAGVAVVGAPTVYQMRIQLEAVGEEWDGSYRPLNDLSYAPQGDGKPQISKSTASTTASNTFACWIGAAPGEIPTTGALFETTTGTPSTAASNLATAINASNDPRVKGVVKATSAGSELTVTGVVDGVEFSFFSRMSGSVSGEASFPPSLAQVARRPVANWELCVPPLFINVIRGPGSSTDRLRYEDAVRLAQRSVYKCYRIAGIDAGFGGPIIVPGYGPNNGRLKRRQQIILTDRQVEQVKPQPLDERLKDRLTDKPFLENFYNGYSRDKPAVCFGAMANLRSSGAVRAFWVGNLGLENTPEDQQIFVDFSVDAEQQLVIFNTPVFRTAGSRFLPAKPVLQTGVMIRNVESNAVERFHAQRPLPNGQGHLYRTQTYPDIQLNIVGEYDSKNRVVRARVLESDPIERAKYYLDGMAAQYPTVTALTRTYHGIQPLDLDGAISQISWEVGDWAGTTASRNSEHSYYVPPYPSRRRREFLDPANQQRIEQQVNPPRAMWPSAGGPRPAE